MFVLYLVVHYFTFVQKCARSTVVVVRALSVLRTQKKKNNRKSLSCLISKMEKKQYYFFFFFLLLFFFFSCLSAAACSLAAFKPFACFNSFTKTLTNLTFVELPQ